jgi:molecular chaperone DnaJ
MAAKDLYEKDLYTILGVKKSDSDAIIKKQYRKLSKELHPDATKGDKKLEERFKEVSEAYEVLSDPKKKAEYNEMRDLYKSGGMRSGPTGGGNGGGYQDFFGGGGDPQDIFSTLFGGGGRRGPSKGADLQTEATISFRDSIFGSEINLRLESGTTSTRVPAGVKDGSKLKLKGRGAPGGSRDPDVPTSTRFLTRSLGALLLHLPRPQNAPWPHYNGVAESPRRPGRPPARNFWGPELGDIGLGRMVGRLPGRR